ncbi:MAG TPA: response regulator [Planctomycetota bacterium]
MNELNGSVALLALPDLLQYLSTNHKAGVLTVSQGRLSKSLHLSSKGMRLLSITPRRIPSLVEVLIRTRKFSRAQLAELATEQKKTGKRLGELVSRLVTKADVDAALREQAQEEIYDLFLWSEARFEFKEGPEPPTKPKDFPLADVVVDASPTSVLLEAARRADELAVIRKVVGDETMIPTRTGKPFTAENHGLDPDLLSSVYGQINGRAAVAEVVRLSHYPRFEALRAIYMMVTEYGHVQLGGGTARFRPPPPEASPETPAPETPRAAPRRTILLLSDMVHYRQALAAMIRDANYLVVEETSDRAASIFAEHRKIDAIVLDVGLATRDEYQFVAWLASLEVPVIVLSDDASSESAQAAVRKGARGYLAKPFARDSILRSLSAIVPA